MNKSRIRIFLDIDHTPKKIERPRNASIIYMKECCKHKTNKIIFK